MLRTLISNRTLIPLIVLIVAISLRLTHLEADTPPNLSSSVGVYVDEGYKTLSPRNLLLFNKTHWHEADTYPGWMKASPITQWSIYAAFKYFGANVSSARLVPIIYFSLFVLLYLHLFKKRYTRKLFYLGLVLLVTDITLFTFSRVAIFEIPMSFFVYGLILPLTLFYEKKDTSLLPLAWLLIGSITIAYTVKLSSLVYFAPALAAASILFITNNDRINKKIATIYLSIIIGSIFLVLTMTYNQWGQRIGITPSKIIYSIAENPLIVTSPSILIAGTLCAGYIIGFQSKQYFNNLYRLTLLCMVIASPLLLSFFKYAPLRYYVPFIPAYILLTIEWLNTISIEPKEKNWNMITLIISAALFGLAIIYSFVALKLHEYIQLRYLIVISIFIILLVFYFKQKVLTYQSMESILSKLIILALLHSAYFISSFIYKPSYDAKNMRNQLTEVVASDAVIAGGWAPFLTLGTSIRPIYANTQFNTLEALKIIEPDYFLLSDTPTATETFNLILEDENIITYNPIYTGTYNMTNVKLYPMSYKTKTQ